MSSLQFLACKESLSRLNDDEKHELLKSILYMLDIKNLKSLGEISSLTILKKYVLNNVGLKLRNHFNKKYCSFGKNLELYIPLICNGAAVSLYFIFDMDKDIIIEIEMRYSYGFGYNKIKYDKNTKSKSDKNTKGEIESHIERFCNCKERIPDYHWNNCFEMFLELGENLFK